MRLAPEDRRLLVVTAVSTAFVALVVAASILYFAVRLIAVSL